MALACYSYLMPYPFGERTRSAKQWQPLKCGPRAQWRRGAAKCAAGESCCCCCCLCCCACFCRRCCSCSRCCSVCECGLGSVEYRASARHATKAAMDVREKVTAHVPALLVLPLPATYAPLPSVHWHAHSASQLDWV